jgi:hypothetical protein
MQNKTIQLTAKQKIIAVGFILFTAIQGALIVVNYYDKTYYVIAIQVAALVLMYQSLIQMMKWAASTSNSTTS